MNAEMDGYRPFRRDVQGRREGEAALYVREGLHGMELSYGDESVKFLSVSVRRKYNKGYIVVGICYRPPKQDEEAN